MISETQTGIRNYKNLHNNNVEYQNTQSIIFLYKSITLGTKDTLIYSQRLSKELLKYYINQILKLTTRKYYSKHDSNQFRVIIKPK